MSHGEGAEGGSELDTGSLENPRSTLSPSEKEIDDLWDRLGKMNASDRRKTLMSIKSDGRAEYARGARESMYSTGRLTMGGSSQSPILLDNTPRKLKNFSGSNKLGPGEIDFTHWKRAAMRIVDDRELSEARMRTIVTQSICGIAEDAIDLYRDHSVRDIIDLLDKIFGSTTDGHDLLADFYQIFQAQNQSTSDYLNNLYIQLCEVVKQGGLHMNEVTPTLLRQFQRGTTDEEMLLKLRLDSEEVPPEYPQLIVSVRREEARRTQRRLRARKVVRSSAATTDGAATTSPPRRADDKPESGNMPSGDEVLKLKHRVAELEAQNRDVSVLAQKVEMLQSRNQRFCYRCGEDGHMAFDCRNPPNKALVEEKSAARRKARGNRSENRGAPRQEATACGKR
jgi:hypothetical protein